MNINSLQHPLVKHLVKLRHNRDYREEHAQIVIDGTKMVTEVCQTFAPTQLLACNETLVPAGLQPGELLLVSEEVIAKITGMQAPEGIIAVVPMPPQSSLKGKRRLLALDGISDPGNMGTLLRTALAFGWEGLFLFHDCCDPYNDKALRAAKGATFHLPLHFGSWDELKQHADQEKLPFFAADLMGTSVKECKLPSDLVLVLGSEAHGLSSEVRKNCQKVTIPQAKAIDSLNVAVAGGILMYLAGYEKP